jgi:hypothetical protein
MPKWSHYLEVDDDDELDQPIKFQKIKRGQRSKSDEERFRQETPQPRIVPVKQKQT